MNYQRLKIRNQEKFGLTVVVIFHDMKREAARTLYSLTREYQRFWDDDLKVIAIDSNSTETLTKSWVESFGSEFEYVKYKTTSKSPAEALNYGISRVKTTHVCCLIDGARILSPAIFNRSRELFSVKPLSFVYTIGMHIGPKKQNLSVLEGYNQHVEDELLAQIEWQSNPYRLFEVSSYAGSSKGFFSMVTESNCFVISVEFLKKIGSFDEGFATSGGGLVNLDIFIRIVSQPMVSTVCLLGEATFHQFHGGVSTNVDFEQHPFAEFMEEYEHIKGHVFYTAKYAPSYWGSLSHLPERLQPLSHEQAENVVIESAFKEEDDRLSTLLLNAELSDTVAPDPQKHLALAIMCSKYEKWEWSILLLNKIKHVNVFGSALVNSKIAWAHYNLGELKRYRSIMNQLEVYNNELPVLSTRLDVARVEGKIDDQIPILKQMIERTKIGINGGSLLNLQRCYFRQEEYEKAMSVLQVLSLYQSFDEMGALDIAICHAKLEQSIEAQYFFETVNYKSVNNRSAYAHFYLKSLTALSKNGKIINFFESEMKSDSLAVPTALMTIDAYTNLGKLDKALELLDEMDAKFPTNDRLAQKRSFIVVRKLKKMVLVVGMHRSGTSCLAGALSKGGIYSGDVNTWHQNNNKGNQENYLALGLNNAILSTNFVNWKNANVGINYIPSRGQKIKCDEFLGILWRSHDVALIKDPRITFFPQLWSERADRSISVGTFRHPLKVALSLLVRDEIGLQEGLEIWLNYNQALLDHWKISALPIICFDSTTVHYAHQLDKLNKYLKKELDIEIDMKLANSFYEGSLDHGWKVVDDYELAQRHDLSALYARAVGVYSNLLELSIAGADNNDIGGSDMTNVVSELQDAQQLQSLGSELLAKEIYLTLLKSADSQLREILYSKLFKLPSSLFLKSEIDIFNRSVNESSKSSDTHYLLGELVSEVDDNLSHASFLKSLELNGRHFQSLRALGMLFFKQHKFEMASEMLKRALLENHLDGKVLVLLIRSLVAIDELDEAIRLVEENVSRKAPTPAICSQLIDLYKRALNWSKLESFIICYTDRIVLKPQIWFSLARKFEALDRMTPLHICILKSRTDNGSWTTAEEDLYQRWLTKRVGQLTMI